MDGEQLLREIKLRYPAIPATMTAYGEIDRAVEAMRAGACNYLAKPFGPDDLCRRWRAGCCPRPSGMRARWSRRIQLRATRSIWRAVSPDRRHRAPDRRKRRRQRGFARFIHRHSARAAGLRRHQLRGNSGESIEPRCSAMKRFVHRRTAAHAGKFEQAQGGTLLLDEVRRCHCNFRQSCSVCCRSARSSAWR